MVYRRRDEISPRVISYCGCTTVRLGRPVMLQIIYFHLQDVTYDAYAPPISDLAHTLVIYHFRCHEFGRSGQHHQLLLAIIMFGQAEIDNLDGVPRLRQTQNVLRLGKEYKNRGSNVGLPLPLVSHFVSPSMLFHIEKYLNDRCRNS